MEFKKLNGQDFNEYIQFDRSFGNEKHIRIIIPAVSQNLTRAEAEEMFVLFEEFVSALRSCKDAAK